MATMRAGLVGRWVGSTSHRPRSTVVLRSGEVWRSEAVRSGSVEVWTAGSSWMNASTQDFCVCVYVCVCMHNISACK